MLEELGKGGMGIVFKARQITLNRMVAVKMIRGADHASPDDRFRFLTEAQAMARMKHPQIVQIYEVNSHHGRPYYAMELIEGGTLIQRRLTTAVPTVAAFRKELAESQIALGGLGVDMGRSSAAQAIRNGVTLLDELAATDPSRTGYRRERASAHNTLGMALDHFDDAPAAEAEYRISIRLLEELAALFPSAPGQQTPAATARNNLAVSMENQGRLEEAGVVFRRNLEFWETMAANDPSNYDYQSKLALALDNVAGVCEKTGRKPEAERALRRSADLRTGLTKAFPNTPHYLSQLADELARLAKLVADRGDFGETRRLQEQVVAHRRAVLALAPGTPTFSTL